MAPAECSQHGVCTNRNPACCNCKGVPWAGAKQPTLDELDQPMRVFVVMAELAGVQWPVAVGMDRKAGEELLEELAEWLEKVLDHYGYDPGFGESKKRRIDPGKVGSAGLPKPPYEAAWPWDELMHEDFRSEQGLRMGLVELPLLVDG